MAARRAGLTETERTASAAFDMFVSGGHCCACVEGDCAHGGGPWLCALHQPSPPTPAGAAYVGRHRR